MSEELIVRKAREFCLKAHAGQKRDDGSDYAIHPIAVAAILQGQGCQDPSVLAAALLHDTLEDTTTTKAEIDAAFGEEVAGLVMELTNPLPQDRPFAEKHAALLEHARAMSPKARLVKLADRLHNLRDMGTWPIWKQERYARAALMLLEALKPWPDEQLANLVRVEAVAALTR